MTSPTKHLPFLACALSLSLTAAEYRVLPHLRATAETVHPVPLGFTSRTLLPAMVKGQAPSILVSNHGQYVEDGVVLYTPKAEDGRGKFFSLPGDYPLYDAGQPFDSFKGSHYIAIDRADGLYDLLRPSDWVYLKQVGTAEAPSFSESYKVSIDGHLPDGKEWVADVDGDAIPDLLVGAPDPTESQFQMYPGWPKYGHPWSGVEQPYLGTLPDTDLQNYRGYDIAGNWLGRPITHYLWWAKGRIENDKLAFGKLSKVRYGSTDYELMWRDYGLSMYPVVMPLQGTPHIILFTGNDKAMSVPVREVREGRLHVGKAVPLLKDDATLKSTIHANVIGVGDMNLDGTKDLVVGSGGNGRLTVLSGTKPGEFEELGNVFHLGGPVTADTLAVPVRKDWNGDGLPDLIIGDASGILSLRYGTIDPLVYDDYVNFKTPSGYIRHRPIDGNLQGDNETAWSYVQPEVYDWDRDGQPDILTNDNEAKLFFYKGTGSSNLLEERQRLMLGDKPLPTAWRTRPAVIASHYGITGDERDTLLMVKWNSDFAIAIPDAPGSLNFEQLIDIKDVTGSTINLSGPGGNSGRIKLSVADWDQDGDWDIVFGSQKSLQKFFRLDGNESPTAAAFWLENVGTSADPIFKLPQMITFADGAPIMVHNHNFNVYPTDLNGDGALDIIFGDDEGFFFYLLREQLAWEEDRSTDKQLRVGLQEARQHVGDYQPGATIAAESWTNPASNDHYWVAEWISSQSGIFSQETGRAILKGKPPQLSEIKRYLATPINFDPEGEQTLRFSATFRRNDDHNAGSNEFMEILNLKDSRSGRTLATIGFTSGNALQIKTLNQSSVATGPRIHMNQEYTVDGSIVLKPSGQKDEISAEVTQANSLVKSKAASAILAIEINGIADLFEIELGKEGGSLELGVLTLALEK